VQQLADAGGSGVASCTRRVMRSLFTDQLACKFSWQGRKGKFSFCKLHLAKFVVSAVRSCNQCQDFTVESVMKDWLRHAPARHRASRKVRWRYQTKF
ncbi:unnamed protein product, partial [Ixodes persulcatus]